MKGIYSPLLVPKLTDDELKAYKETQENLTKMENSKYKSTAKQIANNWIGTNKISNVTREKIEDLIEQDILEIRKSIESESGKVSATELITTAAITGVIFGEATKLKVDLLIKNDLEEFKAAKQACKITKDKFKELNVSTNKFFDLFKQIYHMQWVEENKQYAYPLEIYRDQITDIYGLEFQGIDNGRQYVFYSVKNGFLFYRETIARNWLFNFFSNQLGTKIVGMLINGSKENTKLNSGDMIQFYDDRNILWNFRLVKASEKNVEVSVS